MAAPTPKAPSKQSQHERGFAAGLTSGRQQGRQEVRKQVLDLLQEKYMNPNVERGGQYGKEILELTAELSKLMKVS